MGNSASADAMPVAMASRRTLLGRMLGSSIHPRYSMQARRGGYFFNAFKISRAAFDAQLVRQRPFLRSFSAILAFTSFFRRVAGRGLFGAKRMVPFDVWKFLSSFLNSMVGPAPGNRLQWSENAAKLASIPLYLNVGMP